MPSSIYLLTAATGAWALAYCDTKEQALRLAPWANADAFLLCGVEGTCTDTADKMASLARDDFRGGFRQPPPAKTYQLVTVHVLVEEVDEQAAGDYVAYAMQSFNRTVKHKVQRVDTVQLTEDAVKKALQ